jgi:hypothetical protein
MNDDEIAIQALHQCIIALFAVVLLVMKFESNRRPCLKRKRDDVEFDTALLEGEGAFAEKYR